MSESRNEIQGGQWMAFVQQMLKINKEDGP